MHECNDTNDCYINSENGLTISEQHHHCELLQLDAPHPYIPGDVFQFHSTEISLTACLVQEEKLSFCCLPLNSSRAPPFS